MYLIVAYTKLAFQDPKELLNIEFLIIMVPGLLLATSAVVESD